MKIRLLLPLLTALTSLVSCKPSLTVTTGVYFSNTYEKVKDPDDGKELPFYFDSKHAKAMKCMNTYYLDNDIQLESMTGNYFNLGTAINFSTTRNIKCMTLGSRSEGANLTWTFKRKIDSIKVYMEAYVKYDSYRSQYNVDYPTSLTVNNVKVDVPSHSEEDKDETIEREFTINSNTINFVVPYKENEDSEDLKAYRLYIHRVDITYTE